jgi:hypothetical protein
MLLKEEIQELNDKGYSYTIDQMANVEFIGSYHPCRFARRFDSSGRVVRFFEFEPKNITIFEIFEEHNYF